MSLKHLSGPALEPVTLDEAKLYCRIDHDAEDEALSLMITAARELFERETGLVLNRQSYVMSLDAWPKRGGDGRRRIYLPVRPLIEITEVSVTDEAGDASLIGADDYVADAASTPRLVEAVPGLWPRPGAAAAGIAISFDAGFGDEAESVPAAIRLALLKLVAEFYEGRGFVQDGTETATANVADILAPFREARL